MLCRHGLLVGLTKTDRITCDHRLLYSLCPTDRSSHTLCAVEVENERVLVHSMQYLLARCISNSAKIVLCVLMLDYAVRLNGILQFRNGSRWFYRPHSVWPSSPTTYPSLESSLLSLYLAYGTEWISSRAVVCQTSDFGPLRLVR